MDLEENDAPSDSPPKHLDPEYMLKGVQAFAVGVVLFGVTFAISRIPFELAMAQHRMPI